MQEETTVDYEVLSLASGKTLSRADETTPYTAVEIRGEVLLDHALGALKQLHATADEVVYRADADEPATLIYSRIPGNLTRPAWVTTHSWSKEELALFHVHQQKDTAPSLTLVLGAGTKFLAQVYTHDPYTKHNVQLTGITDTATFLITAHWFMLGGARITYTP